MSKGAPKTVGKYQLYRLLGKGGMGEVWMSRHPELDIPVAIKLLPASILAQDPSFADRFLNEARTAARLHHANAVNVLDAGQDQGQHYIVMEYVGGGDIAGLLRERGGPLTVDEAVTIIEIIADVLAGAAKLGLVHRDIKPQNFLLTEDGEVKLTDLGIAKMISADGGMTATGVVLGTPHYMAPEQALDSRSVDQRADIYALGITLYQLLTNRVPFDAETPVPILMAHIDKPLPDPRLLNPEIPDEVVAVIRRMTAKKPEDRYQSCTDLLVDLEAIEAGKPPPGVAGRPRRRPSSSAAPQVSVAAARSGGMQPWHWVLALSALVLLLAVFAGVVALTHRRSRRLPAAAPEAAVQPAAAPLTPPTVATVETPVAVPPRPPVVPVPDTAPPTVSPEPASVITELPPAPVVPDEDAAEREREMAAARALQVGRQLLATTEEAVADAILKGANDVAHRLLAEAVARPEASSVREPLGALTEALVALEKTDEIMAGTLRSQAGRTVRFTFADGRERRLRLEEISPTGTVKAMEELGRANVGVTFGVGELSAGVRFRLLGEEQTGALDLRRALLAREGGDRDAAARFLERSDSPLAGLLHRRLSARETVAAVVAAAGDPREAMITRLVESIEIARDLDVWGTVRTDLINAALLMFPERGSVQMAVGRDLLTRQQYEEALSHFEAARRDPAFQNQARIYVNILKDTRGITGKWESGAVARALIAAGLDPLPTNPWVGADPIKDKRLETRIAEAHRCLKQSAQVAGIPDPGTTIRPTRDGGLQYYNGRKPWPKDVSCLRQLPLTDFQVITNPDFSDLSPLRGMPLQVVRIHETSVSDLTPLKGAPIREFIAYNTPITSLESLRNAPLVNLHISNSKISDLSPLSTAPLKIINVFRCPITSIDAVARAPLQYLDITGTGITSLEFLSGKPIKVLICSEAAIKDFSVLSTLTDLRYLGISLTSFDNLMLLEKAPLFFLAAVRVKISDLEPLAGKPLVYLRLQECAEVQDLSPLAGAPLRFLDVRGTKVTSLAPVATAPLREIHFDVERVDDIHVLRGAKTLETINGQPASEFWNAFADRDDNR